MEKLRELRNKLGISQRELSERIGIKTTTLFNYETGLCSPSLDMLIKLADFYNISTDELLGRETDTINLNYLNSNESFLIKKILKMNELELAKTKAYVQGLTE